MSYIPDLLKKNKSSSKNSVALSFCLLGICLVFAGCATGPVIKMPKVLPDIVKQYKTATVYGHMPGMYNTGLHVEKGDHFTFIAIGEITYSGEKKPGSFMSTGPSFPNRKLLYRIGGGPPYRYYGESISEVTNKGFVYLGFDDGGVTPTGEAKHPEDYRDNSGYFVIDIIVWRNYDPALASDFVENLLLEDPTNQSLKRLSDDFKALKEVDLVIKRAAAEIDKTKEAISSLMGEEVSEKKPTVTGEEQQIPEVSQKLQEEAKAAIETFKEKESPGIQDREKERKIADLNEKLQQALQSLKTLEELQKRVTEQQQKERELVARVQLLEEKEKQAKSVPIIAILNPKDGVTVESECIPLSGVAEHQRQITKFEILLNRSC